MIITDDRYKTHAGFTLPILKETCVYLWQVLPRSTGMQDAANDLIKQLNTLDQATVGISCDEAVTFLKAWTTDKLAGSSVPRRGLAYNSYDLARDRFFHMFLAMTARQYPSLIESQMVFYSLKHKVDHDSTLSEAWRDVFLSLMAQLTMWFTGKVEQATECLRKMCLSKIEQCFEKGEEEPLHAYLFVLSLFH